MATPTLFPTEIPFRCPPADQKKTYVLAHASVEENGGVTEFYLVGLWTKRNMHWEGGSDSRVRMWVVTVQTTKDGVFITDSPVTTYTEDGRLQWSLAMSSYANNKALFFVRMESHVRPLLSFTFGMVTYVQLNPNADYEESGAVARTETDVTMVIVKCTMREDGSWMMHTDAIITTIPQSVITPTVKCVASGRYMFLLTDRSWLMFGHNGVRFVEDEVFVQIQDREKILGDVYVDPFHEGGSIWYYYYRNMRLYKHFYFIITRMVNGEARHYIRMDLRVPITHHEAFFVTVAHKQSYIDLQIHASVYGTGIISATYPFKLSRELLFGKKHFFVLPVFDYAQHGVFDDIDQEKIPINDVHSGFSPNIHFRQVASDWSRVTTIIKRTKPLAEQLAVRLFSGHEERSHIEKMRVNAHMSGLVFRNTHDPTNDTADIYYNQQFVATTEPFTFKPIVLGMSQPMEEPNLAVFPGVSSAVLATDPGEAHPNVETDGIILLTTMPASHYALPPSQESTNESSTLLALAPRVKAYECMK